jgi:hypothetical protein
MLRSTLAALTLLAACARSDAPARPGDDLGDPVDLADPAPGADAPPPGIARTGRPAWPLAVHRAGRPSIPTARAAPRALAPDPLDDLLPHLTGARLDLDRGAALVQQLDDLPPSRADLGLAGLSLSELYDVDAGCQPPLVHATFSDGGQDWELAVNLPPFTALLTPPELALHTISEACPAALLQAGGPTDDDGCTDDDEDSLFPDDSACRACLEDDGDWSRCVDEAACATTAPLQVAFTNGLTGRTEVHHAHRATLLACAPDLTVEVELLSRRLPDGPTSFDHDLFEAMCFLTWVDDHTERACNTADTAAHVVADAVYAYTEHLRPAGSDAVSAHNRSLLLADITLAGGDTLGHSLLLDGSLAAVSAPVDTPYGWGLHPYEPRPDPNDPDAAPAPRPRDWIAGLTMKTASGIDGIIVHAFQTNRCAAWADLGDGTSRCDDVTPYATLWDDGWVAWFDQAAGTTYPFPLVTLASTGLPDPSAPGGIFTHILGSTTLADRGWEGCAWPDTFAPDRMPLLDTAPPDGAAPSATFDAQTWRFGRPDDPGVVLALATSQRRGFCYDAP